MSEYALAGAPAANPMTRQPIIEEFGTDATALVNEIDALYAKLTPVLRPDYDSEKASNDAPMPVQSDACHVLNIFHQQIGRLAVLRDRLEV